MKGERPEVNARLTLPELVSSQTAEFRDLPVCACLSYNYSSGRTTPHASKPFKNKSKGSGARFKAQACSIIAVCLGSTPTGPCSSGFAARFESCLRLAGASKEPQWKGVSTGNCESAIMPAISLFE